MKLRWLSMREGWRRLRYRYKFAGAVMLLVIVFSVNSHYGGGSNRPDRSADALPPGKYTQTWSRPYAETTCADWTSSMTGPQKFAASADMLLGARKVDGGTGLPGDALVEEFSSGITTGCVIPTMKLTDAAVGLYLTEPRFKPWLWRRDSTPFVGGSGHHL